MQMLVCLLLPHNSIKISSLFFLFVSLIGWIPMPCLSVHWSFLLHHLVYCWNFLCIFQFCYYILQQYDSCLELPYILYLFVEHFTVLIHSSPEISVHFYDQYFELFIKWITYLHFIKLLFCSFIFFFFNLEHILFLYLLNSSCWFLCIKWNNHFSQSWRFDLMQEINIIIQLLFNLSLALGCISIVYDCPNSLLYFLKLPVFEGVSRPVSVPMRKISV